jgi:hypothetical protein
MIKPLLLNPAVVLDAVRLAALFVHQALRARQARRPVGLELRHRGRGLSKNALIDGKQQPLRACLVFSIDI